MKEEWKDIKGYEGLYMISSYGRIKSLGNDKNRKEKILKPYPNDKGYLHTMLSKDGKTKNISIHRLVAETFIPNPDNLPQVNHKDEDKTNCVVSNLEWCSAEYNCNYGTRNQSISKPIVQYTKEGQFVAEYHSMLEAERQNGVNQGNISRCCRGIYKSAGGYKWKYAD